MEPTEPSRKERGIFDEGRETAIHHVHGPLEILAGHGTGKTTILLERYAHLVRERLAWPYEVLLLTFTRHAAIELRERLQLLLGEDVNDLPIYTLHAFARLILANTSDRRQPLRIYDPNRAFQILKQAMRDVRLPETVWPAPFVADLIADAKERGVRPEEFVTVSDSPAQQAVARAYARYQELLAQAHAVDFADLLMTARQKLTSDSQLLSQIRLRCRFVMVDEFQDTSLGQYQFIRLLVGPSQNLFVVGSAAQSIYEWRAANYTRLSQAFQADFPNAKRVVLRDNFRSTSQIVQAAAVLFKSGQYPDVDLNAQRGLGESIRDIRLPTERDEAAFVADEAVRLARSGIPVNEMAVLYRTNRQSALLEREFMRRQVPYVLPQRQRLYHRREVRDTLTYLGLANGEDQTSLNHILNTPPRGIGPVALRALTSSQPLLTWEYLCEAIERGAEIGLKPQALESLKQFHGLVDELRTAAPALHPASLIELTLDRTGYRAWLADELDGESRLNSIEDLQREAEDYLTTAEFLTTVHARIEADLERPNDEGVTFSTIHSAKGLQFQVVFVVGMEEGLLPLARSVENGSESGERRLAHVAFSRARDLLYVVSAQSREQAGRRAYPRPSRYLTCLPHEIVNRRK